MRFFVICLLAFIAISNPAIGFTNMPGCGETKVPLDESIGKIIGGRAAYEGEEPWVVQVGKYKNETSINVTCGGTLLTRRHVLTAAHCIHLQRLGVRMGTLLRIDKSKGAVVRVKEAIKHENFSRDKNTIINDIAMLYLEKDAVFTDLIRPICLPEKHDINTDNLAGQTAIIAGWGRISSKDRKLSKKLMVANVTIFSNEICEKKFQTLGVKITSFHICAGTEAGSSKFHAVGSCKGDSGGPLISKQGKKHFIAGITSFGDKSCRSEKFPGVYTRVSSYLDWIHQHLKK